MRILDLFCGGGGAGEGIHQAFPKAEITGVDLYPQKNYPFTFIQTNALDLSLEYLRTFDFIWASPPCQAHSVISRLWNNQKKHKNLIPPIRKMLRATGIPYAIENVQGAPLLNPVKLCGCMFKGLEVYRLRLFETSYIVSQPDHNHSIHRNHKCTPLMDPRPRKAGEFLTIVGHFGCSLEDARKAMGIKWMDRNDLSQAIPPAYSKYILEAWDASEI